MGTLLMNKTYMKNLILAVLALAPLVQPRGQQSLGTLVPIQETSLRSDVHSTVTQTEVGTCTPAVYLATLTTVPLAVVARYLLSQRLLNFRVSASAGQDMNIFCISLFEQTLCYRDSAASGVKLFLCAESAAKEKLAAESA